MEDFEVHISGIFKDQPIYDQNHDDENQISTMIKMELLSSGPVYDSCEEDYLEISGGDDIEITLQTLHTWNKDNTLYLFRVIKKKKLPSHCQWPCQAFMESDINICSKT